MRRKLIPLAPREELLTAPIEYLLARANKHGLGCPEDDPADILYTVMSLDVEWYDWYNNRCGIERKSITVLDALRWVQARRRRQLEWARAALVAYISFMEANNER